MTNNLVCVSDIHAGCGMAMIPDGCIHDTGVPIVPGPLNLKIKRLWDLFWDDFVPSVTHDEPFDVAIVGDIIDGRHHKSTHQITQNLADQAKIAYKILEPIRERCQQFYVIRGTEAHVGSSGEDEERLARDLDATPDETGNYSRFVLWKEVGDSLCHLAHHIGHTGSSHYESSAILKELTEMYVDAGRWNDRPPDFVIRGHRHRCCRVTLPAANGEATAVVLPGWQAKTPFSYKIPGGRQTQPQFGGAIVRQGDDEAHIRLKVWRLDRERIE